MTDRYTHIRVHDERAVLDTLPDLSLPSTGKQQKVATGTYGKNLAENMALLDRKHRTTMDSHGQGNHHSGGNNAVFQRGRRDSNPQPSDRQSDALTN